MHRPKELDGFIYASAKVFHSYISDQMNSPSICDYNTHFYFILYYDSKIFPRSIAIHSIRRNMTNGSSRKNPYPPHGRSSEIPRGREFLKVKTLQSMYEAKLEFSGGWGLQKKKPSARGVWIFSGTAQSKIKSALLNKYVSYTTIYIDFFHKTPGIPISLHEQMNTAFQLLLPRLMTRIYLHQPFTP